MSLFRKLFGTAAPRLERADMAAPDALQRFQSLIDGERCDEVFTFLNRLKAEPPRLPNTDFFRARCYLKMGQEPAAVEALKEELRWFPEQQHAKALLAQLTQNAAPATLPGDAEFHEVYHVIRPATMLSPARLWSLFSRAREICQRDFPGNFVECGVAAGGSSAMLGAVIVRHSKRRRRIFSCDTFEGLPAPSDLDRHGKTTAEAAGWGAGTCSAPIDSLLATAKQLRAETVIEPVKGLFADTLPELRDRVGSIALLHMDGDWYSSTRDILINLYDQVIPGGTIQIDDYGYWEGCKKAVTEFEQERSLKFTLQPIDETGVWMTK